MSDIQNEFQNVNDIKRKLSTSVADLWHIWVDPDSDPDSDPQIYADPNTDPGSGS